jgi:hypothetical protein
MFDELFDALERKNEHKRDPHKQDRRSDRDHFTEDSDNDHYAAFDNHNPHKHSRDFDFGHLRLTDLLGNKKIKTIALIVIPIVILLLVGIVIIAFPAICRIWEYIRTNGVKGAIDAVMPFIGRLWEGSKG